MNGLPCNIEAEQAVLGALMVDNSLADNIAGLVVEADFFDPVHRDIFGAIARRIEAVSLASPVTLRDDLKDHAGLADLGGPAYLTKLAGAAISARAIRDYARAVSATSKRRSLIAIADDMRARAMAEADPVEAMEEAEGRLYQLAEGETDKREPVSIATATAEAMATATAAYQRGGGLSGMSTSLEDLDRKLGGLKRSQLVILAGRPGSGKTAMAMNIAHRAAKRGSKIMVYSAEMPREDLAKRMLSDAASVQTADMDNGSLSEEKMRELVMEARAQADLPLIVDDTPSLSIAQLCARARRVKRTKGLELLVVDYIGLMRGTSKTAGSRVLEIGEITMGLKNLAKELDIPVLALSQLSRRVEEREDKRPQLSDLRESGSIEQDADVVMFVYRDEYYVERARPSEANIEKTLEWAARMEQVKGKAEVIIGKQRHGSTGGVELAFEGEYTRFGNLARNDCGY